ncbi:hypothetical protein Tco_0897743 [Tanacetum coccineum]
MANLVQDNSALAERLNKHGSRLYNLENLNIPQKVNKAVDEIVTDAVDWALQAPLHIWPKLVRSVKRDQIHQEILLDLHLLPSPPPPPSPGVSGASDSIKLPVATHQSSAWTISDTRDKPSGSSVHHLSPPEDQQMNDDLVPADEEHTFGNDDLGKVLKVPLRKDWWKPCDDDEKPATSEPAWVIPTSYIPDAVNNWANALATTYTGRELFT